MDLMRKAVCQSLFWKLPGQNSRELVAALVGDGASVDVRIKQLPDGIGWDLPGAEFVSRLGCGTMDGTASIQNTIKTGFRSILTFASGHSRLIQCGSSVD